MAGLGTGAGPPVVNVYHEKSRILPDVSRVLACLYEKEVKFETIKASYKDLLSLQAARSVPVPFYDGPVFLQDSRAICRYIAETYEHQGYPFLLGKDVLERASIEQWLRHEEHAFDPPSRALFCHIAFPPQHEDDDDHEGINREMRKLEEVLEVYEQRLSETEFLAGNKFTLADLVHLPGTHHVITSDRFAYLYDSRKNVQRWWNEISARESWQNVLRDMKIVEEEHALEKQRELEEQQKQKWLTEPSPTFGGRDIRIDPRKQGGTKSQTVLVPPPSTGTISASIIPPSPQDRGTTSDQKPSSPNQIKEGGFFTAPEKPPPPSRERDSTTRKSPSDNSTESTFFTPAPIPTTAKTQHQKTDTEKFTHKDAPSPTEKPSPPSSKIDLATQKTPSSVNGTKSTFFAPSSTPNSGKMRQETDAEKPSFTDDSSPSKRTHKSPKEAPYKPHLSDFFKASDHKDEAGSLAKPSTHDSSKIPRTSETSDTVFTDKDTHRISEPDSRETKSKPTGVSPQVDKPVPLTNTTPDTQTPQTPYLKPPEQRGTDTSIGSETGQKSDVHTAGTPSNGDTHIIDDVDRFSTKRLRAVFNPDIEDSQYPAKQEEAPVVPKNREIHDREKKTTMIPDTGESGDSPSTNVRPPYDSITEQERSDSLPPKEGMVTKGPEKSPSVQQSPPSAPRSDKLAKTAGANIRAPQGAAPRTPTDARSGSALVHKADPSTTVTSDEQTDKSPKMGQRKLEATPSETPPADSRGTSAPVREVIRDAHVKQAPAGLGDILDVQDTGDGDVTEKDVDKRAAEPTLSPHKTTEPIKGVNPTLQGITSDESTKAAPPAPVQEPASSRQNASIVPPGGTLDTNGKEADKPSPVDPRGTPPTTQGRLAPTPGTQHPTASGKISARSPDLPLSDTRNEKTGIAEPTLSPQQTTEPIKGVDPTLQGITDDDSTKAAPPAPVQALASSKQNASIVPPRGALDTNGKEAAKTSPVDPSGTTPTTQGRLAPNPDIHSPTASGKMSAQSPELPLPDTRNEKTGIAQISQTSTAGPNEQLRNTSIKLHEYVDEAYKEQVSAQQQPGILSGDKLAENRTREGDDVAQNAETGKPKEEDHNPNANENNNRKAQATTTDGPSKLQIQSGVNESKTSNDSGAGTNETANSRSLETSREILPSTPTKSVEQKQLQGNRFGTSVQNNVKRSSEAGALGSGTEQQKKNNVPTDDNKNNGKTPGGIMHEEKISSDTQQVTDEIRNSKSDSSSRPEGDEENFPGSQKRSPTNL